MTDGAHDHPAILAAIPPAFDPSGLATKDALDALTKRVAALEAKGTPDVPPPVEPPVTPPANDYPAWTYQLAQGFGVVYGPTIAAPTTIPHDGVADTAGPLAAWIMSASGSKVLDLSTLASPLWMFTGNGLDLRGIRPATKIIFPKGQRISWGHGPGTDNHEAFILLGNTHDIEIDGNGSIPDGSNPGIGTSAVKISDARSSCLVRNGASWVNVHGFHWVNVAGYGPGTFGDDGAYPPPDYCWFHDYTQTGGEWAASMTSGRHVMWSDWESTDTSISPIDIEPDAPGHVIEDIAIVRFRATNWGWYGALTPWMMQACPKGTATNPMARIFVADGVTSNAGPQHGPSANAGGLAIRADKTNAKDTIVVRRLTTTTPASTNTMRLVNVHDLEVQGCVQPRTAGVLVSDVGTTGTRLVQV